MSDSPSWKTSSDSGSSDGSDDDNYDPHGTPNHNPFGRKSVKSFKTTAGKKSVKTASKTPTKSTPRTTTSTPQSSRSGGGPHLTRKAPLWKRVLDGMVQAYENGPGNPACPISAGAKAFPWVDLPLTLATSGWYFSGFPAECLPTMHITGPGDAHVLGPYSMHDESGFVHWSQDMKMKMERSINEGKLELLLRPRGRKVIFEMLRPDGTLEDTCLGLPDSWLSRYLLESDDLPPDGGPEHRSTPPVLPTSTLPPSSPTPLSSPPLRYKGPHILARRGRPPQKSTSARKITSLSSKPLFATITQKTAKSFSAGSGPKAFTAPWIGNWPYWQSSLPSSTATSSTATSSTTIHARNNMPLSISSALSTGAKALIRSMAKEKPKELAGHPTTGTSQSMAGGVASRTASEVGSQTSSSKAGKTPRGTAGEPPRSSGRRSASSERGGESADVQSNRPRRKLDSITRSEEIKDDEAISSTSKGPSTANKSSSSSQGSTGSQTQVNNSAFFTHFPPPQHTFLLCGPPPVGILSHRRPPLLLVPSGGSLPTPDHSWPGTATVIPTLPWTGSRTPATAVLPGVADPPSQGGTQGHSPALGTGPGPVGPNRSVAASSGNTAVVATAPPSSNPNLTDIALTPTALASSNSSALPLIAVSKSTSSPSTGTSKSTSGQTTTAASSKRQTKNNPSSEGEVDFTSYLVDNPDDEPMAHAVEGLPESDSRNHRSDQSWGQTLSKGPSTSGPGDFGVTIGRPQVELQRSVSQGQSEVAMEWEASHSDTSAPDPMSGHINDIDVVMEDISARAMANEIFGQDHPEKALSDPLQNNTFRAPLLSLDTSISHHNPSHSPTRSILVPSVVLTPATPPITHPSPPPSSFPSPSHSPQRSPTPAPSIPPSPNSASLVSQNIASSSQHQLAPPPPTHKHSSSSSNSSYLRPQAQAVRFAARTPTHLPWRMAARILWAPTFEAWKLVPTSEALATELMDGLPWHISAESGNANAMPWVLWNPEIERWVIVHDHGDKCDSLVKEKVANSRRLSWNKQMGGWEVELGTDPNPIADDDESRGPLPSHLPALRGHAVYPRAQKTWIYVRDSLETEHLPPADGSIVWKSGKWWVSREQSESSDFYWGVSDQMWAYRCFEHE